MFGHYCCIVGFCLVLHHTKVKGALSYLKVCLINIICLTRKSILFVIRVNNSCYVTILNKIILMCTSQIIFIDVQL